MTPELPTPDVTRLLAEAEWVRRLAARLVGGAQGGDDLAQDTLVAALEHGGPRGEVRNARAWLAAIAKNLALRGRRRERERTGVERRAARAESLEGARTAVERMELQRLLADAVLALPEPQRSAVIWRHLDGLSAAEIAGRQGVSAELARQRVSRGLALLRERLDRSHGSRGAWCVAFAGALRLEHAAPATALGAATWGGIAVASKGAWMVVGAAGVAAIVWLATTRSVVEPRASEPGPASVASELQAPPANAPSGAAADARPDSVASTNDARRALTAPVRRVLRGEVVSRRGEPVAGAELGIESAGPASEATRPAHVDMATDAQGRFEIEAPAGEFALLVRHPEYLVARVPCEARDGLRVVLAARPVVTGRLLDPDGAPVAGPATVTLTVRCDVDGRERGFEAECLGDGTFRSGGSETGRLIGIRARASGWERAEQVLDLALEAEGHVAVDVALSRGYTVTGVVLDARTRAPIPTATVWAEGYFFMRDSDLPHAVTDENGRFAMSGLTPGMQRMGDKQQYLFAQVMLGAQAEGYITSPLRYFSFLVLRDANDPAVEILLEPALGGVSGRVLLPGGEQPAVGETVLLVDAGRNLHFGITDSEGRFAIGAVAVGPFALRVQSGDEVPVDERLAGEVRAEFPERREVELVLARPSAVLEGRVLDRAGNPVFGVAIEASSRMSTGAMAVPIGFVTAKSDASGRYRIEHLMAGQCTVTVASGSEGAAIAGRPSAREVEVRADATVADCDFEVATPIVIAGRVATTTGSLNDIVVMLLDPATDAELKSAALDASGGFSFGGLFPLARDVVVRRNDRELARARVGAAGAKDLLFTVSE